MQITIAIKGNVNEAKKGEGGNDTKQIMDDT
ncbi:hypothetical protein T4C_6572 [Trichinella pseudospiralis]|uniref:Uncharacterized protein n=1 Tax=Trichinella pseudospiralis TaxID=6337 RepID=A0A0V1IL49_TRIPS|nr:hypothetical protein T4C_6572 [Trichinella pseudospiralis]